MNLLLIWNLTSAGHLGNNLDIVVTGKRMPIVRAEIVSHSVVSESLQPHCL